MLENVTGVILAGGRATRMGGQDKGLIEIAGKTIVERIARQLSTQVPVVLINANRNLDRYQKFGHSVIADELEHFQGPLAGMVTALRSIQNEWLLTVPCDGPFLAGDYASKMMQAADRQSVSLVVASDGKRLQPVYALIRKSLVDSLDAFLQSGERKIDRWYAQQSYAEVSFVDKWQMFTNINTPEQLRDAELSVCDDPDT